MREKMLGRIFDRLFSFFPTGEKLATRMQLKGKTDHYITFVSHGYSKKVQHWALCPGTKLEPSSTF